MWFRFHGLLWQEVTCSSNNHIGAILDCEEHFTRSSNANRPQVIPKRIWRCPHRGSRAQYPVYGPFMSTRGSLSPMSLLVIWFGHARGELDISTVKEVSGCSKPTIRKVRLLVESAVAFCGVQHHTDAVVVQQEATMTPNTLIKWARRKSRLGRAPHERLAHVTFLASMAAAGPHDGARRVQQLLSILRLYARTCDIIQV